MFHDLDPESAKRLAGTFALLAVYISFSGGLVALNKYLLEKGHFPHPMALNAMQMGACICLSQLLYWSKPQLFPAMEATRGRRWEAFKWFIPLGGLAAATLYCGNMALMWCSVPFVQFMKEGNVVIIFMLSWLAGLQCMNRQRLFTLSWIMFGASMCVTGELHFAFTGFLFQAASQSSDATRAVMAEWVLGGRDLKIDPMTYTMIIAPVSMVALVVGNVITWNPSVLADLMVWWPVILPNVLVAFCLNVMIAAVIKTTSAVGLTLTGIVKDMVLVVYSSFAFNDPITMRQWGSFSVTLTGVFFWSYMKLCPDDMPVQMLTKALGGTVVIEAPNEKTALLPGDINLSGQSSKV